MPLTREVLILAFTLGGADLKLADLYGRKRIGYVFAAVAAVSMGLLISDSPSSSSIMLGIILGVALAGKVDQPNLIMGLGLTLATAVIAGFTITSLPLLIPDLSLLIVVMVTALIDEVGHDRITSGSVLVNFFRFRMTLKTTMVLLTVLTQIDIIHAVGFFCFDLSYDVVSVISLSSERSGEDSLGKG